MLVEKEKKGRNQSSVGATCFPAKNKRFRIMEEAFTFDPFRVVEETSSLLTTVFNRWLLTGDHFVLRRKRCWYVSTKTTYAGKYMSNVAPWFISLKARIKP